MPLWIVVGGVYLGVRVQFLAVREDGARIECVGRIVRVTSEVAVVEILSPLERFVDPPEIELVRDGIVSTEDGGWRYVGRFHGGILVSAIFWK